MGCFRPSKDGEDDKLQKETNKRIEKQLQKDKQLYRATHRLLLLGQYRLKLTLFMLVAMLNRNYKHFWWLRL